MKVILAVTRDKDIEPILDSLLPRGFSVTKFASMGGFLKRGSTTLLIGVEETEVEEVIKLLKIAVGPPDTDQHRITLFVMNAVDFNQI